jgi:GNAT superfamily N-acetyltransferase
MEDAYTFVLEAEPAAEDVGYVSEQLAAFNRQQAGDDQHQRLAIFVRDGTHTIVAGLVGDTYWGWLSIALVWVDAALRQQGIGTRLLQAAEAEAVRRGCHHAHVDTMSFQALPFYLQAGYTVWGELADLPVGHRRYFLQKALPTGAGGQ